MRAEGDNQTSAPLRAMDEEMKRLLHEEVGFLPAGPGLERMLESGEWIRTEGREVLVEIGRVGPDVFIVREGIIRVWDYDKDKERTFGFGLPGTIFASKHSFVMSEPSHYQVETCCPSLILRIPRRKFWEAVNNDHSLALFMPHNAYGELYSHEVKNSAIHNGTAKERFMALAECRPMIMENVPQKILASYLGITSEYFSVLKREILKGKNNVKKIVNKPKLK